MLTDSRADYRSVIVPTARCACPASFVIHRDRDHQPREARLLVFGRAELGVATHAPRPKWDGGRAKVATLLGRRVLVLALGEYLRGLLLERGLRLVVDTHGRGVHGDPA